MAFANKNKKNEGFEAVQLKLADYPYQIKNTRALSDNVAVFTLDLGVGVSLYNVKLVDSKNGMFIAPAESKSGDKYYKNYGLYLDEDSTQLIIDEVTKALQ